MLRSIWFWALVRACARSAIYKLGEKLPELRLDPSRGGTSAFFGESAHIFVLLRSTLESIRTSDRTEKTS